MQLFRDTIVDWGEGLCVVKRWDGVASIVIGLDTSISCITSVCIVYSVVVVFISIVSFKSLNKPNVFVRSATTRTLQGSFIPVTVFGGGGGGG